MSSGERDTFEEILDLAAAEARKDGFEWLEMSALDSSDYIRWAEIEWAKREKLKV